MPIHHALTLRDVQRYRVEPYVVAADVYSGDHEGRGGPDDDHEAKYIRLGTKRGVHRPIVALVTSFGQPI